VPTTSARVRARVSAVLIRVAEVEQAALRRGGELQPRQRRRMAPEGLDPHYSDSYVPTEVDVLAYGTGDSPQWTTLGRLGGGYDQVPPAGEERQPVQDGHRDQQ
jgi:hypothetical protein